MTEEEFGVLYTALRDSVFGFAVRRVGDDAADDIVAETFAVAWQKRAEFPPDRSSWAGWIVGIAKNKVLQELERRRRKHHDNRFVDDWLGPHRLPSEEDVARVVVDSDVGRRVYQQLSPAEKLLFDLAFFRDLRPEDGAEILGINVSAFTSRVRRLRIRLQEMQSFEPPHLGLSEGESST